MVDLFFTEQKRKTFNQLGEEGLKGHGGSSAGAGYTFTGDPRQLFSQFFGPGMNPFNDMLGGGGMFNVAGASGSSGLSDGFMDFTQIIGSPLGHSSHKSQDPPIEHTLNLSLEELYSGCAKKMKISRQVLTQNDMTIKEDKLVTVHVKPGWKAGTKVTFPKEGDQVANKIPSDVVFVIGEKKHQHFERDGINLRYNVKLTLKNALCGGYTVSIPTIEGGLIKKTLDKVVSSETVDVLSGYGMPISKQPGRKGDLLVKYSIIFPANIMEADKKKLAQILSTYQ